MQEYKHILLYKMETELQDPNFTLELSKGQTYITICEKDEKISELQATISKLEVELEKSTRTEIIGFNHVEACNVH